MLNIEEVGADSHAQPEAPIRFDTQVTTAFAYQAWQMTNIEPRCFMN